MRVITMSEPCRCCGGTEYVCAECDYEPLEAQHDDLLAACKALLEIVEFDYALHIDNAYWPTVRPVYEQAKAAVARGEHDVPTDA